MSSYVPAVSMFLLAVLKATLNRNLLPLFSHDEILRTINPTLQHIQPVINCQFLLFIFVFMALY